MMLLAYVGVAIFSAMFPLSGRSQTVAADLDPIYLCATPAHSDFFVPLDDPEIDWLKTFGLNASDQDYPGNYIAIGWGDFRFFTEAPSWAHVTPGLAVSALSGSNPVALRVYLASKPANDETDCHLLNLDREGRKQLSNFITKTLSLVEGKPKLLGAQHRNPSVYFSANGAYSPLYTCNSWVADGLKQAGLTYARFAPFSFSVTWPINE
jgi:uncharacterized protein (TIGR02117 family)